MGQIAFETARRMRWPAGNVQVARRISISSEEVWMGTKSISSEADSLSAPFASHVLEVRVGGVPILHVNRKRQLDHDPRVSTLEPVIPPAERLISPFDLGAGLGIVGKGVIPRPDDGLHRSFDLLKHARDGIAIAVEQATNEEAGKFDFTEWLHRSVPELAIALMLEIHQRPWRRFEARA